MNKIEIDARVIIQINNHTFEMNKQEARDLYNKLHDFFGSNTTLAFPTVNTNPWDTSKGPASPWEVICNDNATPEANVSSP